MNKESLGREGASGPADRGIPHKGMHKISGILNAFCRVWDCLRLSLHTSQESSHSGKEHPALPCMVLFTLTS